MYIPYSQAPNVEARPRIAVRTAMDPAQLVSALRESVGEVDRGVPIDRISSMDDLVSSSAGQPRFRTAVILMFSLLALFVAAIGLYGVMSYGVSQRTQEFGIRIALGASRANLMALVLGHTARLLGFGIAAGLAGTVITARAIATLLFGVKPADALTLAGVTALLALVGMAAGFIPARRAARCDPMESLRQE
jgi:putative ABC transport system permease protein